MPDVGQPEAQKVKGHLLRVDVFDYCGGCPGVLRIAGLFRSAAGDEDRRRRVPAECRFEGSGQEVTPVVGKRGAKGHGTSALKANDTRCAIRVHGADSKSLGDRFEFGNASCSGDAEWADAGKDGEPVSVDRDCDFA